MSPRTPETPNNPKPSPWLHLTVAAMALTVPAYIAAGPVDPGFILNGLLVLFCAQLSRPAR
jgi:hypothetical protein